MADLFEEFGIDYHPTDLFEESGIAAPKAAEVNAGLSNQLLDVDKYKETSRLYDARLEELKAKRDEKSVKNMIADLSMDENGDVKWQWYNPISWIGSAIAEDRKYLDDQIRALEQNEEIIKSTMTPERFKEIKDFGAVGIYESFKKNIKWENAPFAGGFIEGYKKGHIADLMEKIRDGEELSEAENATVKEYLNDQIELGIRGTSFGGKIVDGVSRMPAFMIEYGVAKGLLGKAGSAAAKTEVGQKVASAVGGVASKIAATGKVGTAAVKTAEVTSKAVGRAVFMPSLTYNTYNDMRLNDIYSLGENGQILFSEDPQNKATMVLKSFGLASITALAEDSGEAITALAKKGASPIFNKLPANVRNGLVKLARQTEKYKDTPISQMFSKGGYSNLLGEIGEERLEDLLGAVTGLNPQGDTYFDSIGNALLPDFEQFMVEAGVISVAGGARSGLNYLYSKGYSPKFLKSLSTSEQDQLVEKEVQRDLEKPMPENSEEKIAQPTKEVFADEAIEGNSFDDVFNPYDKTKAAEEAPKEEKAPDEKIVIDDSESWVENWNRHLFDTVAPLEKISDLAGDYLKDGQRPDMLARAYQYSRMQIEKNIRDNTYIIDENGNEVTTGEGFVPILKDFTSTFSMVEKDQDRALDDFNDYLVAIRYTEDLDEMDDVEVTEQQKVDAVAKIASLQNKYGENYELLDDFARRVYEYQQRILHNLVDSGNLSEEQFKEIVEKHKHYVPFKRVLEERDVGGGISGRPIFDEARTSKAIKRIRGSEKAVKNVFVSIEMNSANILDLAYRNRIARSVAGLQTILPEYIQPRKPLYEHGKTKTKVAYDPKLRQQLEAAIHAMGGKLEYVKSIKEAGHHGLILGSYSDDEKTIRKRLGSQDRTLAHEFGHMLDFMFNTVDILKNPVLNKEINKLAEQRFYPVVQIGLDLDKEGNPKFTEEMKGKVKEDYIRSPRELMANMFDLYFTSRDFLKKTAPETYKFIEKLTSNKELRFLRDIQPSSSSAIEEIEQDAWIQSKQKPFGNVIEYYENGQKKYVEVAKPIYEAMHQLNPIQAGWLNTILRIGSVPAKVLRFGAVTTPNFILRNFIKDQFTAFVQTEKGMKATPFTTLKALCNIVGHGELYDQWQKSGGSGSGYYDWSEDGARKYIAELNNKKGRFWKALKWIGSLQFIQIPSQAIEEATRLGAFTQAKKAGLSDLAAGIASREATVDFGRGGDVSKLINRLVPFFNVGMQSANKLYRTAKNNPSAFMFNSLATIAFPSIMITGYYLYGAPEEERKKWLEIPDYVRDNNWCFFIEGREEPITFPKPFTVGYMGTIIEDFMIWGYKGDKPEARSFYDVMLGAAGSLSPIQTAGSLLTPVGQVAVEATTNYNFFQGRSIYPSWMERLPAEERMNKRNTELGKAIGKSLKVSPAVVDNTLFGLTSTLGRQIIQGSESMIDQLKRWNGQEVPEDVKVMKDVPIVGAVMGSIPDGSRSKSYQEFARNYKELSEIKNAYNSKSGEEKAAYKEKHHEDLSNFKRLDAYRKQIRKLQKQVNELYDDPKMSSEEKTKQVRQLERQITETAFNANRSLKREN